MGQKFDRKMEEAIAALLTHQSVDAAARAIDVAPAFIPAGKLGQRSAEEWFSVEAKRVLQKTFLSFA